MAIRTTPPILLRDGPAGSQLAYINTKAMLKDTAAALGDMPLGPPCLARDPSTGRITGLKQTFARGDHSTYCATAAVCPGGNCPTVWYCTEAEAVEVAVGDAVPTDYVSGPYLTKALALADCPIPRLGVDCPSCGTLILLPQKTYFNMSNVTGWLAGRIPNSFEQQIYFNGTGLPTQPNGCGYTDRYYFTTPTPSGCDQLSYGQTFQCLSPGPGYRMIMSIPLPTCLFISFTVVAGPGWTWLAGGQFVQRDFACGEAFLDAPFLVASVSIVSVDGTTTYDVIVSE